jgi:rare lipoprotein A
MSKNKNSAPARGALALAAAGLAIALAAIPAEAKTPGSTYCFNGICHRVSTLAETEAEVGHPTTLATSFYDDCRADRLNPCGLTSSGEPFRPDRPDNAASPVYPDGTQLLLFNPASRKAAVVRVNNAGPYYGTRKLDVSRAAAERLGFHHRGTANLVVRVVKAPRTAEATYAANRRYRPVAGYIGEFPDANAANKGFAVLVALKAVATSLLGPMLGGAINEQRDRAEPTVVAAATEKKVKTTNVATAAKSAKPAARVAKGAEPKKAAKAKQMRELEAAKAKAARAIAAATRHEVETKRTAKRPTRSAEAQ